MTRNMVILGLTLLGFLVLYWTEKDPMILAVGCWTLAGVYAIVTSTRRWL